jgi:hypothetical protein
MRPIKYEIIDLEIANSCYDPILPKSWLDGYKNGKANALEKIDIFQKNGRELNQVYTRFDLFQENSDPEVYVSPYYLELFEFAGYGHLIPDYVKEVCNYYKNNIVVFQWNHDNDFSMYSSRISRIENARVINFGNTQIKKRSDILVPFWNYNTKKYEEDKKVFCNFVGSINNQTRYNLASAIIEKNDSDIVFIERLPESEYLKYLSSSSFSLCPQGGPGNGGFSYRFFECMHLSTIPVLMVDNLVFPYTDKLDWGKICVRLPQTLTDISEIKRLLLDINQEKVLEYIDLNRMKFTLGGVQETVYERLIEDLK